jgi:hypothetical protein
MADLATLDGDEITAGTRIEVERVDTVEDIVKTYLIGVGIDEPVPELAVETASDKLSEPVEPSPIQIKAYVDQLEQEEEQQLEPKNVNILTEGQNFEGITVIAAPKRDIFSDTESVDSIAIQRLAPRCPTVDAMCVLQRKEDRSSNEVIIAQARLTELALILRRERYIRKEKKAAYGMEREGQEFKDQTILRAIKRYESAEEEEEPKTLVEQIVQVKQPIIEEPDEAHYELVQEGQHLQDDGMLRRVRKYSPAESDRSSIIVEHEPPPASYDFEQPGKHYDGASMFRKKQKRFSDASVEDIAVASARRRGGITHVTAVKKEDSGFFEIVIPVANKDVMQRRAKEVPDQQYENLNYFKAIDRMSGSTNERIEKSMSAANLWKGALNVHEFSTENLSQHVHVERREFLDQDSEADRSIRERRTASVARDLIQYSVSTENCSVLLENRGAIQERTQRGWAEEQRGRLHSSSSNAVVRSVSLNSISTIRESVNEKHQQQLSLSAAGENGSNVVLKACRGSPSDSFAHTHLAPSHQSAQKSVFALSAQSQQAPPLTTRLNEQVYFNEQQTSRSYVIPNLKTILPPHASTQSFFGDALQEAATASRSTSVPPDTGWTQQISVPIRRVLEEKDSLTQFMSTDLMNQHQFRRQESAYGTEIVLLEIPDGRFYGVQLDLRSSSLPPYSFRPISSAMLEKIKQKSEVVENFSESWATQSIASSEAGISRDFPLTRLSVDNSISTEVSAPPILISEVADQFFRHSQTFSSRECSEQSTTEARDVPIVKEQQISVEVSTKPSNLPFNLMSPIPELSENADKSSSADNFFRGPHESVLTKYENVLSASVKHTSPDPFTAGKPEIDSTFETRDVSAKLSIEKDAELPQQTQIIQALRGLEEDSRKIGVENVKTNVALHQKSSPFKEVDINLKDVSKIDSAALKTRQSNEREIKIDYGFSAPKSTSERTEKIAKLKRSDSAQLCSFASKKEEKFTDHEFNFSPDKAEMNVIRRCASLDSVEKRCCEAGNQQVNYYHSISLTEADEKLMTSVLQHAQSDYKITVQQPRTSIVVIDKELDAKSIDEFVQKVHNLISNEVSDKKFIISQTTLEKVLERIAQNEVNSRVWIEHLKQRINNRFHQYGNVKSISVVELSKSIRLIQQSSESTIPVVSILEESLKSSAPIDVSVTNEVQLFSTPQVESNKIDVKLKQKEETDSTFANANLDSYLKKEEHRLDSNIIKSDSRSEILDKGLKQAGDESINYFGDIKITDKIDQVDASIDQINKIEDQLKTLASSDRFVFIDKELDAKSIDEFVQKVHNLIASEAFDKKFVISHANLLAVMAKIQAHLADEMIINDKQISQFNYLCHSLDNIESFTTVELVKVVKSAQSIVDGTFDTKEADKAAASTDVFIRQPLSIELTAKLREQKSELPDHSTILTSIDVSHQLSPTSISEFIEQVNLLIQQDRTDRRFTISALKLDAVFEQIRQHQEESNTWIEKLKDILNITVPEYGKVESFSIIQLEEPIKRATQGSEIVIFTPRKSISLEAKDIRDETFKCYQNTEIISDTKGKSETQLKEPIYSRDKLDAKTPSSTIIVVDKQLTAKNVEEFAHQINTIAASEKSGQTLVVSKTHLDSILENINQNQDIYRTWITNLKEDIKFICREFENAAVFVAADIQKVLKSSNLLVDINFALAPSQQYPVEFEAPSRTLSTDVKLPSKQSLITELTSTQPSLIEINVDKELKIDDSYAKFDVIKQDALLESTDKKMRPSSEEVSNYQHEVKIYPEDKLSASTVQHLSRRQLLSDYLNLKASHKAVINVDRQLDATRIDEFIQQVERIASNEKASETFIISIAHLDATLRNLQGE